MFIAHRGNTCGPKPQFENEPEYVVAALRDGYYVEVDVWLRNQTLFLGHEHPQHEIPLCFLRKHDRLVCHAKTPETLFFLSEYGLHCFFHDTDEVVLTSEGWMWTYPGGALTPRSIAVMPELIGFGWDTSTAMGVCSDYAD